MSHTHNHQQAEGRVELAVEGRLATITLRNPPLNILDLETISALDRAFTELAQLPQLQLVLLQGDGDRAFCAGVAVEIHTPDLIPTMLAGFHGVLRKLWDLPAITVAVVHSHCLGGGMELAAVCDFIVADENARFGQPEIKVGCYPPVAAALYPALMGRGTALDLIVTGRLLSAIEALQIGFVTRVAEAGGLPVAVRLLKAEILGQSAIAQQLGKKALRAGLGDAFTQALEASEKIYLEEMANTADVEEGARAFLEKRPPVWQHR